MNRKLAFLAASSMALLAAAPVAAGPLDEAISATVQTHLDRRGLSNDANYILGRMAHASQYSVPNTPGSWLTFIAQAGKINNWFPLVGWYGFPEQMAPGTCINVWCEGADDRHDDRMLTGFPGDDDCEELTWDNDVLDHVKMPSASLAPGTPIIQGQDTYGGSPGWGAGFAFAAFSDASILWEIHHRNLGRPEDQWAACTKVSWLDQSQGELDCIAVRPSYVDPVTGNTVPRDQQSVNGQFNPSHWLTADVGSGPGDSEPCPEQSGSSGDFDFYTYSSSGEANPFNRQDGCTFYAKNLSLSPNGYAYPTTVSVPISTTSMISAVASNPMAVQCRIAPELIRLIADRLFKWTSERSDYTGPVYVPFLLSDVRVGSSDPIGRDLFTAPFPGGAASVTAIQPSQGSAPATFVPTGGGGGDPTGDDTGYPAIDIEHPVVDDPTFEPPELTLPDWFPDFDVFEVPEGTGQCPEFGFSAMGQSYTMPEFCPMVEDYRVLIASIMLVVWSIMSYFVVLRA